MIFFFYTMLLHYSYIRHFPFRFGDKTKIANCTTKRSCHHMWWNFEWGALNFNSSLLSLFWVPYKSHIEDKTGVPSPTWLKPLIPIHPTKHVLHNLGLFVSTKSMYESHFLRGLQTNPFHGFWKVYVNRLILVHFNRLLVSSSCGAWIL